jgi:hypothetical protein
LAEKKMAKFEILENARTENTRMENAKSMQRKMPEFKNSRSVATLLNNQNKYKDNWHSCFQQLALIKNVYYIFTTLKLT